MSASSLVADAVWNSIESTRSVTQDQLSMSVVYTLYLLLSIICQIKLVFILKVYKWFFFLGYFNCSLHFLFGKNFERATRIVDQRGVKRISGEPSGRSIFQVHCILFYIHICLHGFSNLRQKWCGNKFGNLVIRRYVKLDNDGETCQREQR